MWSIKNKYNFEPTFLKIIVYFQLVISLLENSLKNSILEKSIYACNVMTASFIKRVQNRYIAN